MSPRARSLAALGVTLALGIVLGLLLGGRLAARRFDRLAAMAYPPHLVALLHESLDLDGAQLAAVDSLLEAQGGAMSSRVLEHRRYMRQQLDSVLHSLRPHLRDEQWRRLQEHLARPQRRGPGWGPPPGMGPPGGFGRGWRHRGGRGTPPDSTDGRSPEAGR